MTVTICCKGGDAIRRTVENTQRFSIDRGLEPGQGARLAIIVEELVTNLVEHGAVDDDGRIELSLSQDDDGVMIVLSDSGAPFDPRDALSSETLPERGGGAGIDLVRAWAAILDYRTEDGWNRLRLKMHSGV